MGKMKYRDIPQPNYRHVGKYRPRVEAKDIVTGKATFLDDFSVPNMLYGKAKRSPYPHARIISIDTSKAEALEGVRAVITYKTCRRNGAWAFLFSACCWKRRSPSLATWLP